MYVAQRRRVESSSLSFGKEFSLIETPLEFFQDLADLGDQLRDFVLNNIPCDAIADAEVLMGNNIAKAANFPPFY